MMHPAPEIHPSHLAIAMSIVGFLMGWVAGFASHAKLQWFDGDYDEEEPDDD